MFSYIYAQMSVKCILTRLQIKKIKQTKGKYMVLHGFFGKQQCRIKAIFYIVSLSLFFYLRLIKYAFSNDYLSVYTKKAHP